MKFQHLAVQWGWILCHRALLTQRKHKATQARTISKDSELSWSCCTSPRHTSSCYFRGAHLLLQSLSSEMDFRQIVFPFLLYMKIKGTGKSARLHLTGCCTNRWQLLLQRDLLLPEQQHLDISVVTQTPHPGYFHLQVFCHGHHYQDLTPPEQ